MTAGQPVSVPGHPLVEHPGQGPCKGEVKDPGPPRNPGEKAQEGFDRIGALPDLSLRTYQVQGSRQRLGGERGETSPDGGILIREVGEELPGVPPTEPFHRSEADRTFAIVKNGVAEWSLHGV